MPEDLRRLHVLVEGQTEETLVRNVFEEAFLAAGYAPSYSVVKTRRTAAGPDHKGGVASWSQVHRDIRLLLGNSSLDVLTTLFDYYGFPADAPGMSDRPPADPWTRVTHVEKALSAVVGDRRFQPHLVLHETEAWVFAAAAHLDALHPGAEPTLVAEAAVAGGPELVNDGPATAPSKRLLKHCSGYNKVLDGPLAISALGLPALRATCPHLDAWLTALHV